MDDIEKLITWTQTIASRWDLTLDEPIKLTAKGVVYKVIAGGRPAVLKARNRYGVEGGAVPFLKQVPSGIAADLLRSSPLRRVVLLEFVDGKTLRQIADEGDEASAEILLAEAAAQLKRAHFPFPFVLADLGNKMASRVKYLAPRLSGPNSQYLERTASLLNHLIQTTKRKSVIHGDLHFGNLILSSNGVRMIDAKGFRADPSAEFATALVNSDWGQSLNNFSETIERRARVFGPIIQEESQRVIQWGAAIWIIRNLGKDLRKGPPQTNHNPFISRFLELARA